MEDRGTDLGAGMAVVVDDDDSIREAVCEMLQEIGVNDISTAEDGQAALRQLESGGVTLLILDLMMPNVDGYEVLSRLRNGTIPRPARVIVMSAHTNPDAREGILAMGADDFLPKPFSISQLQTAIGAA